MWRSIGLAVLFACLILLPNLGHRSLTDWDEGIYAEIAREMLAGHSWQAWLVPHWNGQLWFEKPPLQMWLTALSMRLFGLNAFAARLPSALAGVATVGLLHAFLLRRFGRPAAWAGAVVLLSAFGFQHVARAGETDALLSFFSLIAVMGLAEVQEARPRGWLLFWAGFGLAFMTKGAGSVTLPLTFLVMLVLDRPRTLRFAGSFWSGLLLFGVLVVPWHAVLFRRYGSAFLHEYLGFHVLHRATAAIEGHSTHPWFYLWVLLVSAPLFALLYPWACAKALAPQSKGDPPRGALRPFAIFALLTFCLFTAVRTRLPHYVAPVYPAFSALVGVFGAAWFRHREVARPGSRLRIAGAVVAAYAVCALATVHSRQSLHSPRLPDGRLTPDNRESAALLKRAVSSGRGSTAPGPLLVWRAEPAPITTDAFYGGRLVQPASPAATASPGETDRYSPAPASLEQVAQDGQLLLTQKALLPLLPPGLRFAPLAAGPTEIVGLLFRSRVASSTPRMTRH